MGLSVVEEAIQEFLPDAYIEFLGSPSLGNEMNVPFIRKENDQVETEDMSKVSHMLIAGTTGTGKTAFIQSLLVFMAAKFSPDRLKFMILDSKGLEYFGFNKVPHMLLPVITDLKKADTALSYVEAEIKSRLTDKKWSTDLFIVVDDYATMSMEYVSDDGKLMRILQLGRSVGVHFWLSTSIPTAKIISTELKLNIPYRVAFHVTSKSVSRMILDENGAEYLVVPGGMKYRGPNRTITGTAIHIEDEKVDAILNAIAMVVPRSDHVSDLTDGAREAMPNDWNDTDTLITEAGRFVIEKGKASIGMLQRAFRIGFNRAARIMDQLVEFGVVGEEYGTRPQAVLMSAEQFEQLIVDRNGARPKSTNIVTQSIQVQEPVVRNRGIDAQKMSLDQGVLSAINPSGVQAFQHPQKQEKSAINRLGDAAVAAFSVKVDTDEEEDAVVFTPRPQIQGKEAGLEVCDDHIEITKRLNWMQTATYEFKPKRIKRVVYHEPTLVSTGYVRFELDSFEWNVTDNRTAEEKIYTKKLPEQTFTVKFERFMQTDFEAYAHQIAVEAGLDYITE